MKSNPVMTQRLDSNRKSTVLFLSTLRPGICAVYLDLNDRSDLSKGLLFIERKAEEFCLAAVNYWEMHPQGNAVSAICGRTDLVTRIQQSRWSFGVDAVNEFVYGRSANGTRYPTILEALTAIGFGALSSVIDPISATFVHGSGKMPHLPERVEQPTLF